MGRPLVGPGQSPTSPPSILYLSVSFTFPLLPFLLASSILRDVMAPFCVSCSCIINVLANTGPLVTKLLMGQYCFARWRLLSVVVCRRL